MINPYDLGEIVENTPGVEINDLVHRAKDEFKAIFAKSKIDLNGTAVSMTSSQTRFGGLRLWFLCPKCNKRRGVLYLKDGEIACRICFGLKYKKQRYKGMMEANI